jgi:hypothetical protein
MSLERPDSTFLRRSLVAGFVAVHVLFVLGPADVLAS